MATCSCPGCDQPGTHHCSSCKSKNYCGPTCQTTDWPNHREECPGHLRKVGMAHLEKARGFDRAKNFPQTLRHADIAATKLKKLKDCPIELIDGALRMKYTALLFMVRHQEALECAKEWYLLYPTNHTHPPAIEASFCLIESCGHCKEFYDAALFARTLWETITLSRDSHIPDRKRDVYTARGAYELARALWSLAEHGDMPAEEQKETGVEAIMLARRALEINTQVFGAESAEVAGNMSTLGDILDYFNDVDDDEVLRLYEQAIAIIIRVQGSASPNVAIREYNMGVAYRRRGGRAYDASDLDRGIANMELALLHYLEAARIYRAINHAEAAYQMDQEVVNIEKLLQIFVTERAATDVTRP